MNPPTPLLPSHAREKIARLAAIQRAFTAGDGDAVALFHEYRKIFRELKATGLTDLQIEAAVWHLEHPE